MKSIPQVSAALVLACAAALPTEASAAAAPAGTTVVFESDLGAPYRLERVRFWIDGALRYDGPRPPALSLSRGHHLVSVAADYRLADPVFSYVRDYRIEVRSAEHVVGLRAPGQLTVRTIDSGGVTVPLERRARMVWQ